MTFRYSESSKERGWLVLALMLAGSVAIVFLAAQRSYRSAEIVRLEQQSVLYATTLSETLERFAHLPPLLGQLPVIRAAPSGSDALADPWLERTAAEMGVEAIYVMDTTGLAVAASNHRDPITFLGQNYSFRPYFQAAMDGARGEFFAIGATTARPGYFFSAPVETDGEIEGVVVVKLDLSPLVERWRSGGERVLVTNREGIIVLSSDPALTYRTVSALPPETLGRLRNERQFGAEPLTPLDWEGDGAAVTLDGTRMMRVSRALPRAGWTLHVLANAVIVTRQAITSAALFAGVLGIVALIWAALRAARMRAALASSQAEEAKLTTLNTRLHDEVAERRRAEEALQVAQHDLARASRLAALGEVSATVTHELGQPLSALRNYLVAAELNPDRRDDPLISQIEGVIRRMERTTSQLRDFSRPAERDFGPVDLRDTIAGAHALMAYDLSAAAIDFAFRCMAAHPVIEGNAHGLEQVVVNLMRNAAAAMEGREEKRLDVTVRMGDDGGLVLTVEDTGEGIGDTDIETMTAPFYTTRSSGDGMGLGLAISSAILREHGAELEMRNRADERGVMVMVLFPKGRADG